MGSWDFYCFLCAAGFNTSGIEDDDDDDDNNNDQNNDEEESGENKSQELNPKALFSKDDVAERMQWLTKFRLLGLNRNAPGLTQCYLTGSASEQDYGDAYINERGEHPNADNIDQVRNCYRRGEDETGDLPVHDSCFAILCKVFAWAQGSDFSWTGNQTNVRFPFDLDALFACLAPTRREYNCYLQLDHGFQPDQYFFVEWEQIHHYFDPLPDMDVRLPTGATVDSRTTGTAPKQNTTSFLDSLPHELLIQILDQIPQADLVPLIKASKTVDRTTRDDKFWQRRLLLDMPWLWELQNILDSQNVKWHECYNNLMMQTLKPFQTAARGTQVSGLANRRRIWRVCEQVLQLYLASNDLVRQDDIPTVFDEDVACRYLPLVATRSDPKFSYEAKYLFNDPSDIDLVKRLKLGWTKNGALCGISMTVGSEVVTFGDSGSTQGSEECIVEIEAGDWIESIILNISVIETWITKRGVYEINMYRLAATGAKIRMLSGKVAVLGKEEGYKRLLEPYPDNGIVGLKIVSAEGRITQLGVLEHPAIPTTERSENDECLHQLLWTDPLPSSELRFSTYHTGYWMPDTGWDLVPMQTLLFGTTDLEQSTMTGFGAAMDLRRLEIYRSDGSCEQIGQCEGPMKVFHVDGPGGERISGYELTIGQLPLGITLVTTRGRQVVFGRRVNNSRHGHTSQDGYGIAGLYCSFNHTSAEKDMLSSVGLVQSPHIERQPMDEDRFTDNDGLLWEPRKPPFSWHAVGEVFGPNHRGEVAMYIDFARPVSKIDGLFPAPAWLDEIEVGGFVIHYGDDNPLEPSSHFGFPPQQWPEEADATPENLRAMRRHVGMSSGARNEVDTGEAHALTDEDALQQPKTWDLGQDGEKLVAITVWARGYVNGLQFHSESGKDSPRWGKCGGEPSVRISAGGRECIVGLKVIMGANRVGFSAPTLLPQAVQAMSNASP